MKKKENLKTKPGKSRIKRFERKRYLNKNKLSKNVDPHIKVSILITTYNRLPKVIKCLTSLEYTLARPDVLEWIIVDNNSSDGTKELLISKYNNKNIKLISSNYNLGVAGARSLQAKLAQGNLLLFLDSDVVDTHQIFIDKLKVKLQQSSDVGVIGIAGAKLDINSIKQVIEIYNEGYVDSVTGYCSMFDRTIFEQGCDFDQFFNPYWIEDADICMQAKYKLNKLSYIIGQKYSGLVHNWGCSGAITPYHWIVKWNYFLTKWQSVLGDVPTIDQLINFKK